MFSCIVELLFMVTSLSGPRPLKRFTPPPEGEYDDSDDEEYSDEEYSDEEDEEDDDEDEEEESDDDDERPRKPKYKDEILEMVRCNFLPLLSVVG